MTSHHKTGTHPFWWQAGIRPALIHFYDKPASYRYSSILWQASIMPVLIHFHDKPALYRYSSILHRYVYTHIYTYLCTYIYFPEGMFTYFLGYIGDGKLPSYFGDYDQSWLGGGLKDFSCWPWITMNAGGLKSSNKARWWFQICFFVVIPKFGEMIQFDEHILQMGWHHQLDKINWATAMFKPWHDMNHEILSG